MIGTRIILCLALLAAAFVVGCADARTDGNGGSSNTPWAIALVQVEGYGHASAAEQQARTFSQQTGLNRFHVVSNGPRSFVYFGRYDGPKSDRAKHDLETLKKMRQQGRFLPQSIVMGPMVQSLETNASDGWQQGNTVQTQWNLARVTNPGAVYTLQIASFNEAYEGDRRAAAEQRVSELRGQGADAYYYHGPRESLVTIGLFGHAAVSVNQQPGPNLGQTEYHPHITDELQAKYPHVQVNGRKVRLSEVGAGSDGYVPTFLVRTPAAK